MSRVAPVLLAVAVSATISPAAVSAQTEERSVLASVLDRAGTPVTALTAKDFVVREDGVEREILRVSAASDPLQIAVLVDTSQAIRPHVAELREGLRSFFRQMQGPHEIALYEFGERPTRLVDYTSDPRRLDAGVGRLFARPGAGAYLLDAIVDVSRGLRARERGRPVIVVITTEGPEFSERYHRPVLDEVREAGAALHSFVLVRTRASILSDAAREREFTLANGASMSGGRREYLLTSMALTDRLVNLASELKNQLQVVYARPRTLIVPDTLEVRLNTSALTVRAPRVPHEPRAMR
jgi:VWFA-related protein